MTFDDDGSHGTLITRRYCYYPKGLREGARYPTQHIKLHNNPYREGAILHVYDGNNYSKNLRAVWISISAYGLSSHNITPFPFPDSSLVIQKDDLEESGTANSPFLHDMHV